MSGLAILSTTPGKPAPVPTSIMLAFFFTSTKVLFACNNAYCINEKKAIKLLETFEYKPEKYAERVNHIFEVLGLSLFECYDMTEKLYKEVKKIATEINNFLNEENSDERKQI